MLLPQILLLLVEVTFTEKPHLVGGLVIFFDERSEQQREYIAFDVVCESELAAELLLLTSDGQNVAYMPDNFEHNILAIR